METTSTVKRRRGRAPGPKTDRYQVLLSPELAEWGKQQPGGLSGFLRRLMEEARSTYPPTSSRKREAAPANTVPGRPMLGLVVPGALDALVEAIRESRSLLERKDNWDGEGSPGYTEATWERACLFVLNNAVQLWRESGRVAPAPAIYPGPDGSIDVLWESGAVTLLVNVPPQPGEPAKWYGSLKDGSETTKGTMDAAGRNLRLMTWLTELATPGS